MTNHTPITEEELAEMEQEASKLIADSKRAFGISCTIPQSECVIRLIAEVRRLRAVCNTVCFADPDKPMTLEENDRARKNWYRALELVRQLAQIYSTTTTRHTPPTENP